MSDYRVDIIVIGAGAVGLAIAESLSRSGREVIVLESEDDFGKVTSSRNSGVIHAGIYYPENSLKSKFEGNEKITIEKGKRRFGDSMMLVSNTSKLHKIFNWHPKYNDMAFIVKTAIDWEKKLLNNEYA